MKQFEHNTINSFQEVRKDVLDLFEHTKFLLQQVHQLQTEIKTLQIPQQLVAAIDGKVHQSVCVFAKNIKAKNKKSFATVALAKKAGHSLCRCLS